MKPIKKNNEVYPIKENYLSEEEKHVVSLRDDYIKQLKKMKTNGFFCFTDHQKLKNETVKKTMAALSTVKTVDNMSHALNIFHRAFDHCLEITDWRLKEFLDVTGQHKGVQVKKLLPMNDYYLGEINIHGEYEGEGFLDLSHSRGLTYHGHFRGGKFNGSGYCELSLHDLVRSCKGNFYQGRMLGQCKINYSNGESYEGTVTPLFDGILGMPSGDGEYTFCDGKKLSGKFKLIFASRAIGFPDKGIIRYPDNTVYEGDVVIVSDKNNRSRTVVEKNGNDVLL